MKKSTMVAAALCTLWLGLTAVAWLSPSKTHSDTERRELQQFPELSGESVLSGEFMEGFESFTLDQFPLRDNFRTLKALFHYNLLGQRITMAFTFLKAMRRSWIIPSMEHLWIMRCRS